MGAPCGGAVVVLALDLYGVLFRSRGALLDRAAARGRAWRVSPAASPGPAGARVKA